jgi:hypothetical protein
VKMQLKLKFGAATLYLTDYRKAAMPDKPAE